MWDNGSMFSLLHGEPLAAGTTAPEFTLPDQSGRAVSLASLRGRNVVLVFYPRDHTPVCRKQLCEFRDSWSAAEASNTVVLGISTGTAATHEAFHREMSLPFPLLLDEGGGVSKQYRAKGLLWPVRTVYLIGADGRIRYARRGKPDPAEVLASVG